MLREGLHKVRTFGLRQEGCGCLGVLFKRNSKKNLKEAGMTGEKQEEVQRRGRYRAPAAGAWDGVPSALGGCQGLL